MKRFCKKEVENRIKCIIIHYDPNKNYAASSPKTEIHHLDVQHNDVNVNDIEHHDVGRWDEQQNIGPFNFRKSNTCPSQTQKMRRKAMHVHKQPQRYDSTL